MGALSFAVDTWIVNKILEYLIEMQRMPFRAIVAVMENFNRNRKRIRDFVRRPRIANTLKYGMMLTLLAWLVIALIFKGDEGNRLTDAVNNLWSKTTDDKSKVDSTSVNEQPK
jgi:Flp pilus assembly pilin Flp